MESIHILKILSNGWEVPYPGNAFYRDNLLLSKDYRLNDFPGDHWSEDLNYDAYLEWLQDYLFRCEIDLMTWQDWIPACIATNRDLDCASIGWHAGFYEFEAYSGPWYDFPDNFEETFDIEHLKGTIDDPYDEFLKTSAWGDYPPPSKLEFILQQYGVLLLNKKDEEQFQRYWPGFVKMEPLHWAFGVADYRMEPADSGWRVYLSLVLKRIPDRQKRIEALERFFIEQADILHK